MENLDAVKNKIKGVQKNFNPEKATYKILDDVLDDDCTVKEMIEYLGKIKGIEKYPEELKNEFIEIATSLKRLDMEEDEKEEVDVNEETQQSRELKEIINALENEKVKKEEKTLEKEEVKEEVYEPLETREKLEEDSSLEMVEESGITSIIFKVLLALAILSFIVAVLLVLFY